jgi:hypothetical protein
MVGQPKLQLVCGLLDQCRLLRRDTALRLQQQTGA